MELYYGDGNISLPTGFSRFIFDIDLTLLKEKINNGTISTDICSGMTHTLRMVNTSFFDKDYLNTSNSQGRLRATSFDLILFRIPYVNLDPDQPQIWDEGVGYDYFDVVTEIQNDKNYSDRPSNWYQTTTIGVWEQPGIYSNTNSGTFNYNQLEIVKTQHFEFGDENIEFDMTQEINDVLSGSMVQPVHTQLGFLQDIPRHFTNHF